MRVVTHPENRRYGAALASGFDTARKDLIVMTDGDQHFDVGELDGLALARLSGDTPMSHAAQALARWVLVGNPPGAVQDPPRPVELPPTPTNPGEPTTATGRRRPISPPPTSARTIAPAEAAMLRPVEPKLGQSEHAEVL